MLVRRGDVLEVFVSSLVLRLVDTATGRYGTRIKETGMTYVSLFAPVDLASAFALSRRARRSYPVRDRFWAGHV